MAEPQGPVPGRSPEGRTGAIGVLCALPAELGPLAGEGVASASLGLELRELGLGGRRVLTCVGGVGKVRAAQGAAALIHAGARRALLVVGVAGGLTRGLEPGVLVHCTRAVQADFAVRHDREFEAGPEILSTWRLRAPGTDAWFLTADRPVMSRWRRWRLTRTLRSPAVADMETAAAAAVASAAGIPWGALRAVTDRADGAGFLSFRRHFGEQAGRAAATVEALLGGLKD